MSSGYQIVELKPIDDILDSPWGDAVSRAILAWIAYLLEVQMVREYPNVRFRVIEVEYVSRYPALGIQYLDDSIPDLEEEVRARSEQLLRTHSVADVIAFMASRPKT